MQKRLGKPSSAANMDLAKEKPDWWFKLRVELSPLNRFDSEENRLAFDLGDSGNNAFVKAAPKGKLNQARTIDFDVHGFNTREEAHKAGLVFRKSVMLSAAIQGIGLDVGIDQASDPEQEQEKRARGYIVKVEMQGLTVHKGELERKIMLSDARLVNAPDPEKFIKEVQRQYSSNPYISERELLAIELFGLAQFESSSRARLIVLTSVIEVLSEREARPAESDEIIEQLLGHVESSSLETNQKHSLKSSIEELRKEGIAKSCRKLIQKCLGQDDAKRFYEIYDLRSKLLHEGNCNEGEIGVAEFDLTQKITRVFKRMIVKEVKSENATV